MLTVDKYDTQHEALLFADELAETARFCEHYGYALEISANALLIGAAKGGYPSPENGEERSSLWRYNQCLICDIHDYHDYKL